MMKFEEPIVEVKAFEMEDVLTVSGLEPDEDETDRG